MNFLDTNERFPGRVYLIPSERLGMIHNKFYIDFEGKQETLGPLRGWHPNPPALTLFPLPFPRQPSLTTIRQATVVQQPLGSESPTRRPPLPIPVSETHFTRFLRSFLAICSADIKHLHRQSALARITPSRHLGPNHHSATSTFSFNRLFVSRYPSHRLPSAAVLRSSDLAIVYHILKLAPTTHIPYLLGRPTIVIPSFFDTAGRRAHLTPSQQLSTYRVPQQRHIFSALTCPPTA
ncbi:hypothetical protein ACRALDRAFT_212786 [Sodiomyces alcalophilus JCM 7366]|uniref:uncharacterized protein n=1 Tax=Sodiomyces alcalophilus JCM 7366 TaxID=591952 RepID=UPI0039B3BB2C